MAIGMRIFAARRERVEVRGVILLGESSSSNGLAIQKYRYVQIFSSAGLNYGHCFIRVVVLRSRSVEDAV